MEIIRVGLIDSENLKRCFIALELSKEAINEIKKFQKLIGEKFSFTEIFKKKKISVPETLGNKQKVSVKGKFTETENLHLTLKFLGEIDEEKIEKIKEKLSKINFKEFEASLEELGVFSEKFPKIIWIKLKGADELQKEIDEALEELFEKEHRFMSHITLARIKYIKQKKELIEYLKSLKGKSKFKVDKFYLKNSELKPEGPFYKDIEKYELKI